MCEQIIQSQLCKSSRKPAYIILTPLNPILKVKLGFTGVYIDCVYSLELPRRDGSNEYPLSMFCAEI